jgi:hypothetical protein
LLASRGNRHFCDFPQALLKDESDLANEQKGSKNDQKDRKKKKSKNFYKFLLTNELFKRKIRKVEADELRKVVYANRKACAQQRA